jgi:oxygen-independent coproporphyrinogen-3 oxidase
LWTNIREMMIPSSLIQKYNVPAPRYTSYPTVPLWENNIHQENWTSLVRRAYDDFGKEEGISLYIHLPYCESLCTYCGCNKRITKNHSVELPYIEAVLQEWRLYLEILPKKPKLAGIHLGGGTPTFFSPETLSQLITTIRSTAEVVSDAEFSFEGHPNNTTLEHLQALRDVGFTRVSYGIQDFDLKVQKAIHRIQPLEKVKEATDNARKAGYTSINFDLIYGLPHQSLETIADTFEKVAELQPDRIAFYSYAHVPNLFPAQLAFEAFLPQEAEKRALYEKGKELLVDMGYREIGMDHFSSAEDPLFIAKEKGELHRNFMGYTISPATMLIGLGNSSISDIGYGYAQNEKDIDTYKADIHEGKFALIKGHLQTEADQEAKKLILSIICNEKSAWDLDYFLNLSPKVIAQLEEMQKEGLLTFDTAGIQISPLGKAFIRNICIVFDYRMQEKPKSLSFSKAI